MRRIGTLSDQSQAQRFCDYLMTQSILASVDEDKGGDQVTWDIWIRDEQHVANAKEQLEQFRQSPDNSKYQVKDEADRIRDQRVADNQRRKKFQQQLKQKPAASDGMLMGLPLKQKSIPITMATMALCILIGIVTGFGEPRKTAVEGSLEQKAFFGLSFVDRRDYLENGGDAYFNIKSGQFWRVITPMFLHGSMMHLAFNMMGLFFLGAVIERLHGSVFMLILLLFSDVAGTFTQVSLPPRDQLPEILSALAGTPFSVGASGAVLGLFGFLWIKPLVDPDYPISLSPINVAMMLGFVFLCMTPMVRWNIANGAHLGGLLAGMVAAYLATVIRK